MADSILFDGTDDRIRLSLGRTDFALTDVTIAAICKQTADISVLVRNFSLGDATSGANRASLYHAATSGLISCHIGNAVVVSPTVSWRDSGGWVFGAWTHVAGTNAPRFHRYSYDGATWTHEDGATTIANGGTTTGLNIIASNGAGGAFWNGSILVAAAWNSALSDGTIETLKDGLQEWYDSAPRELWRLDRIEGIVSLVGIGASSEESRVGTTLDVGDVPAGWDDSLTTTPVSGIGAGALARRMLREQRIPVTEARVFV